MSGTIEKVISLDSAKLFRISTVVAELPVSTPVSYLNPVEVRSGNVRIGWASLYKAHGDRPWGVSDSVMADIVICYDTPERLSIETCSEKLYARIEGVISMTEEPFEVVGRLEGDLMSDATDIQVLGLEISRQPAFRDQPYLGETVL